MGHVIGDKYLMEACRTSPILSLRGLLVPGYSMQGEDNVRGETSLKQLDSIRYLDFFRRLFFHLEYSGQFSTQTFTFFALGWPPRCRSNITIFFQPFLLGYLLFHEINYNHHHEVFQQFRASSQLYGHSFRQFELCFRDHSSPCCNSFLLLDSCLRFSGISPASHRHCSDRQHSRLVPSRSRRRELLGSFPGLY